MTAEQHQRVSALQELKLIGNNTQRQWVLGRDLQAVIYGSCIGCCLMT